MNHDERTFNKKEIRDTIFQFNNTNVPYSYDKTIYEMFEKIVLRQPNSDAIVDSNGGILSYKDLNEKANQVAWLLRKKGVKANTIVGLVVECSPTMLIGIFAILKAGGAYLPIDPKTPGNRKKILFYDSGCQIILTQKHLLSNVCFIGEIINLDDPNIYYENICNLPKINNSHDLAYVIYTSGSTGQPKGVLIEHHSLINRIEWMQKKYPINEKDILFQKTTYTFDVSVWELLWWSIVGAKVCLLPPNKEHDIRVFTKIIEKYEITVVHFVPSILRLFLEYISSKFDINRVQSLRYVFASGEALNPMLVRQFYNILKSNQSVKLVNLYGPTEATIDVSHFECIAQCHDVIPIGKPIDNVGLLILDGIGNLKPIGEVGELYIYGVGLSRGYLNKPELTNEKFVPNTFIPGTLMYKTGDMAMWLPSGEILFLGRSDEQIKLRGIRIELGEIEHHLIIAHSDVKDAVVTVQEDDAQNAYLCAYIITYNGTDQLKKDIYDYLIKFLPIYMLPSQIIFVKKFPLKTNGKIDRQLLPNPYKTVVK